MRHLHHIIPIHAGGTDNPSNLVELTVEEHAEAHRILWETYGRWQDRLAWQGLVGLAPKAELARQANSLAHKGQIITIEHRRKLSESLKGRKIGPQSAEHRAKIGAKHKGKIVSEETKEKMALAKLGNKNAIGNRSRGMNHGV